MPTSMTTISDHTRQQTSARLKGYALLIFFAALALAGSYAAVGYASLRAALAFGPLGALVGLMVASLIGSGLTDRFYRRLGAEMLGTGVLLWIVCLLALSPFAAQFILFFAIGLAWQVADR